MHSVQAPMALEVHWTHNPPPQHCSQYSPLRLVLVTKPLTSHMAKQLLLFVQQQQFDMQVIHVVAEEQVQQLLVQAVHQPVELLPQLRQEVATPQSETQIDEFRQNPSVVQQSIHEPLVQHVLQLFRILRLVLSLQLIWQVSVPESIVFPVLFQVLTEIESTRLVPEINPSSTSDRVLLEMAERLGVMVMTRVPGEERADLVQVPQMPEQPTVVYS